ncbi:crotonobetainyl-CoA:carnitine CoA-transferase CaiB-like acyl-CoA transferase [Psychrobacter sp. PL15]|uniref:CaiB/BaiF CoA transferase family protein n=1 Tax=Psychrobacter sp. PL15 TaxID=3071719 RepID=UPI002DFE26E1|nr:crotonobetainyl-CoA:carnitine CoA-transferase CaiB-like acyl-CoA transferase [Psychrobacter sp. PL15]
MTIISPQTEQQQPSSNTNNDSNSNKDNSSNDANNKQAARGALHGIKVLDLSRVLAGPSCTQILADLGAEVIKVERPRIGDETRHWAPPAFSDDTSAYYATINRNKKSLTVDITTPAGQTIIKKIAADSDIVVENFKVGGLQKYGLDYESLKQTNPRLIYASLTGFGLTGPDAKRPGYDYIIQGLSGLMSITGPSDGEPHKVGVAVVDLFAGLQLTIGIQAALLARQHTGRGQQVDVALFDSALALLANVGMNHLASGEVPPRLGNQHPNIVPYQVFLAAGEQHFILACGNDQQFAKLCQVLDVNWQQDSRFTTNPARVVNRELLCGWLVDKFAQQSRAHWLEVLQQVGIPSGAIHNVSEALAMPQTQAREMVIDFTAQGSPVRALGNPIKLSESPVTYRSPPPSLSEHTDSTLAALGYDSEMIAKLKADGIV